MENLEKWYPIIDYLNVDKKYYNLISSYAEKIITECSLTGQNDDYLPINLRVLSKLDLDKMDVEFVDPISNSDVKSYTYSCLYEEDVSNEYFIEELKHKAIDVLVEDINKLKSIKIHRLVDSISIKNEGVNEKGNYNIKIILISRYAK